MIRLKRDSKTGFVVADLSSDATNEEKTIAVNIAQRLNAAGKTYTSYKTLMEGLDKDFQTNNINLSDYVDQNTITQIEDIYKGLTGFKAWDASQGKNLDDFDPTFYSKLAPETLDKWKEAQSNVSFAGQKIPDIDVTQRYKDLNEYLHASYSFSGLPGKPKEISPYTEQTRQLTNDEYEILRTALLAREKDEAGKDLPSAAEAAATPLVNVELENTFGALSSDALKQILKEYEVAKKKEQTFGILRGMGLPTTSSLKGEIKNSILGDIGAGGFLSFGKGGETSEKLEGQLDKALGLGSSVQYNWQEWFDNTLAKRYAEMETISDPDDAEKQYQIEKNFANSFVEKYLRPRFDNSKSMAEFVSYIDVDTTDQNVLQTQLASSSLKDLAQNQATTFIESLKNNSPGIREFDFDFYTNPVNLPGDTTRDELYKDQKESFDSAWDAWQKGNKENVGSTGKNWDVLAYEYGLVDEFGKRNISKEDFAKLHYEVVGKAKGFDPVADTYTRRDLSNFIQTDLRNALSKEIKTYPEKTFLEFVTADAKAQEVLDKFGIKDIPEDLKEKLDEAGIDYKEYPTDELKAMLLPFLQTDPAIDIRDAIQKLNEQRIKPTQEELGFTYIQRDEDEKVEPPPGGTMLYKIFSNAGYGGNESEFYKEFFPDATEEDKNLLSTRKTGSKTGMEGLLGFSMPDMTDPFSAIASFSSMMDTEKKETYVPKRSSYFQYFEDEEDEGAPSYFDNMETNFFGGLGSLFG
jgi:hypothetical protein